MKSAPIASATAMSRSDKIPPSQHSGTYTPVSAA